MRFFGFLLVLAIGIGVMYIFWASRRRKDQHENNQNDAKRRLTVKNPVFYTEFGEMNEATASRENEFIALNQRRAAAERPNRDKDPSEL